MTYNDIYNNPFERRRITYSHTWWKNAFTEDELNKIDVFCNNDLQQAVVVGQENVEKTKEKRDSLVKFIERNDDSAWIFDKFNTVIRSLNEQFYNFNLNGYPNFQYTVYKSETKGKYDWHTDTIFDTVDDKMATMDTRKLTVVMLLNDPQNDFSGGEFQLNLSSEDDATTINIQKGMIIAFPSFFIHRVKPVLTGVRKSIVIWVEGPKFV